VISLVVHVGRVVWNGLLLFGWGEDCRGVDAIHCKALACGLSGTYSAVVHVFLLNVDNVFSLLVFVVLIRAEVFTCPISILFIS
jgi:hypothetical protein